MFHSKPDGHTEPKDQSYRREQNPQIRLLAEVRPRWFLTLEGRGVSRVLARGGLRWFVYPLAGVACRGHAQYLAFAPSSSKVAVGFFWMVFVSCP